MLDAGEGHDVARRRLLDLDAIEPEEAQDLHHPLLPHRAAAIDDRDRACCAGACRALCGRFR